MNFKILYNLWRTKKSATPSHQFKRELWQRLDQNFSTTPKIKFAQIWFRWSMVGVASLLIVASLSTGVYAYNSPDVTEGTPLYVIKQKIEKVEESIKVTPEAKAQFLVKTIKRREAEKVVMTKRGQAVEKIEQRLEKTIEQLQKADEALQKMEDKKELKNKEIRPQVKEALEKRQKNLEDHLENKINKQIKSDKQEESRDDR